MAEFLGTAFEVLAGEEAAQAAASFAAAMSARQLDAVLWDVQSCDKAVLLPRLCEAARLTCFAWNIHGPRAMAWTIPVCPKSLTHYVHFACAGQGGMNELLHFGRLFLSEAARGGAIKLVCLIPRRWMGAASYAKALGFRELGIFPRACWIEKKRKAMDGVFLCRDLREKIQTRT